MGWFRDLGRDKPWAQGCIIATAGGVLAVGTCFGALFTMDFNTGNSRLGDAFGTFLVIFTFVCLAAVPVGVIWFIVGLVKNAARKSAPPPAPPTA